MFIRRRDFMGSGVAGLSFAAMGGLVTPRVLARAAEASAKAAVNDHALVVIELSGGNDGLNTVIPFENPLYFRNRRTLAIPAKEAVRLTDTVGLHPRMNKLGALYKEGRVAVVQGVGYPEPNRSHFRSMEIWQTASTEPAPPSSGWLGRLLDTDPALESPAAFPRGLSCTDGLPQALLSSKAPVPVIAQLEERAGENGSPADLLRRQLSTQSGGKDQPVAFLRRQADILYRTADRLKAATAKVKPATESAGYPDAPLAAQLRRAGQVIAADLGVRVLYCSQDGYDTHASQAETHGNLLGTLSDSLSAFQTDLRHRGLADRVAVLVFSEFGRRVDENASKGTDHGAASNLFLIGPKVKSGLVGTYPRLDKLGDGDLIHTTDFRSVYAAILGQWLGCAPETVLGGAYPGVELFV